MQFTRISPEPKTITERSLTFKSHDGAELVGRLYLPAEPKRAIVLNGATGVPQRYYVHFARWLADTCGMACLTYDYRDTGRSWSGPLRRSRADIVDWGVSDQSAARRAMRRTVPGVPLWLIGHSLGAMTLPNQRDFEGVERVIGVATGMVHVSDHPWPYRALAMSFWYGPGAWATAICGYLPGRIMGFGSDLPPKAYWQWRQWCTSRDFYAADLGARLTPPNWPDDIPVRLLAISDDDLIPPDCVRRLARDGFQGKARVEVLEPDRPVGHLSLFARRNADLWSRVLDG